MTNMSGKLSTIHVSKMCPPCNLLALNVNQVVWVDDVDINQLETFSQDSVIKKDCKLNN